jgi:hypothetical protein
MLLAAWARTMPSAASAKYPKWNVGAGAARRPAIAAAVRVIGWTQAREINSQRPTPSRVSGAG